VAPVIDIFSGKKFDVSFNVMPFPVKLYSGTVVPAGILIDIESVAILGGALQASPFHLGLRLELSTANRFCVCSHYLEVA
jgi:hypothetical protein